MNHTDKITKILSENIDADFENDPQMQDMVKTIVKYINEVVAAASKAAKPSAATKSAGTKSGTKPYSQFVKFCGQYAKGNLPDACSIVVTPGDYYKNKNTPSYAYYNDNLREKYEDQPIEFSKIFTIVHDGTNKAALKTAGICWGMLSSTSQQELLDTMPSE